MKKSHIILIIIGSLLILGLGIFLYIQFGMAAAGSSTASAAVLGEVARRKMLEQDANKVLIDEPTIVENPTIPVKEKIVYRDRIIEKSAIDFKYHAIVERRREKKGPGVLKLYKDKTLVGEWECITGHNETNPKAYGGLTPTMEWVMIEKIENRKHPSRGSNFSFARIIPLGNKEEWKNRTFEIDRWPFMIHISGKSTGCIAILPKDWSACRQALNKAFEEQAFIIKVVDID